MKKLFCFLLTLALCLTLLPAATLPARAEEASGSCGESVNWTLDAKGNLTISGWGPMRDYVSAVPHWNRADITAVVIEEGVTTVGIRAFADCPNLKKLTLPEGLVEIGSYAFRGCTALTAVSFPSTLAVMGEEAFKNCSSLAAVILPDKLTRIEKRTFEDCIGLKSLQTGARLESIGPSAFQNCSSLTDLTLSAPLYLLEDYAFRGCSSLPSVTLPDSLVYIGNWAFYSCSSLTSFRVSLNHPLYTVRDGILYSKDATELILCPFGKSGSVVLPNGLTALPRWAFDGCVKLTDFTIPLSVTEIGDAAFGERSSPFTVYYEGSREQWDAITTSYYNQMLGYSTIHCNDQPTFDTNGDGWLNLKDVYLLYRAFIGSADLSIRTCDVNRDGCLSLKDVALAFQHSMA
ncbi:MAG: leucine-rich repeat protein [Oscillospiraceae bacterium]|nr:leucine-rich repeat protein [Oscillospiraceae bacterium]